MFRSRNINGLASSRPPSCGIRAIQGAGAKLRFLPPYSPDFNPIEMAFSKLKASLKRRAARTIPELWDAIGEATNTFTPSHLPSAKTTSLLQDMTVSDRIVL